jgi:hypothetical protein
MLVVLPHGIDCLSYHNSGTHLIFFVTALPRKSDEINYITRSLGLKMKQLNLKISLKIMAISLSV